MKLKSTTKKPGATKSRRDKETKAPHKLPVPLPESVVPRNPKLPDGSASPLGVYLKLNTLSTAAFSRAMGCPLRTIQQWVSGQSLPSLPAAYEIERMTKGVVPMEAWLAHPGAKSMIAEWRSYQPEGLRGTVNTLDAGGFAGGGPKLRREARAAAREEEDEVDDEQED